MGYPYGMHVVVMGDPFDGMTVYGPFQTGIEATDWAETATGDYTSWWAVELKAPEEADVGGA